MKKFIFTMLSILIFGFDGVSQNTVLPQLLKHSKIVEEVTEV